jgi:hypothetical protein
MTTAELRTIEEALPYLSASLTTDQAEATYRKLAAEGNHPSALDRAEAVMHVAMEIRAHRTP